MMSATSYFGDVDVDLRHRRPGHQGPVHAERRHQELPPVEPVFGRQRHAAAGDGRSVRREDHRLRRDRLRGRAVAQVQLRLRRLPGQRSGQLPEGGLLQGGAARRAWRRCCRRTSGSTWCRSRAWPRWAQVRPAGRDPVQPGGGQGPGRLHQGTRPGRRGLRAPALRRGGRHRRRVRDPARGQAPRVLDLRRHGLGHRPRVDLHQRRDHALPLLPEHLRPHLHRRQHARRATGPLHQRLLLREGDGRIRRGDAGADRGPQEADEAVPQPGRHRVQAAVPALLRPAAAARGGRPDHGRRGRRDAARRPPGRGRARFLP